MAFTGGIFLAAALEHTMYKPPPVFENMFSVFLFPPLLLFLIVFLNSSVVEFSTAASAASGATDTQLAREIPETSSAFSVSPPVKLTASQLVLLLSLPLVVFFVVAASLLTAVSTGTASMSTIVMS